MLDNIADYDVSYPIVFDVEMIVNGDGRANGLSQKDRTDIALAFCDKIKAAGYTYMPYEVGIWQYTEKGTVAGIKTGVDLNISYKEY